MTEKTIGEAIREYWAAIEYGDADERDYQAFGDDEREED